MGLLEDNFSDTLSAWKADNFKGTQKDLGELFGVTQAQINRILNKTRSGDEEWRRMVAKKIGIPYDEMIGLKKYPPLESKSEPKTEAKSDGDKGMEVLIKHLLSEHKQERAELNKKIEELIAENKDLALKVKELEMKLGGYTRGYGTRENPTPVNE